MSRAEQLQTTLASRAGKIAASLGDGSIGVSVFDYLSGFAWGLNGDRWFHAASTSVIRLRVLARSRQSSPPYPAYRVCSVRL